MNTYYLRMEGVNLSNFVYDTKDLNTIRGGGLLLLEAVERVHAKLKEICDEGKIEAITTGASSGLFEFSASNEKIAKQVRKDIEKFLNSDDHQLKHATFVVDTWPSGGEAAFAEDKEMLIALNRWRQMQSPAIAVPLIAGNAKESCATDLVRPAGAEKVKDKPASDSVYERHEYGKSNKRGEFYQNLPVHLKNYASAQTTTNTGLFKSSEENAAWLQRISPEFTNDLDEISRDKTIGNLDGKIAVIYADGNSFGKMQSRFTKKQQARFDQLLKAHRASFLLALLGKMGADDGWKYSGKYRLETLLWGGDEFMLVVPAWKGWETVKMFFDLSKTWQLPATEYGFKEDKQLTHSVGLVFCHHSAHIKRIKDLAHDLAEVCKTRSIVGEKGNYVAYQALESFDHIAEDIEAYLKRMSVGNSARHMIIDGEKMEGIAARVATVKADPEFARGRLHGIVKGLRWGTADAAAEIKTMMNGISEEARAAITELAGPLHVDNRWLHLADLWDYIAAPTEGTRNG